MLSLGPNSVCDVCLDAFSHEKAPWSISCGHVYCSDCLDQITRPQCPLCRIPFDQRSRVRLHVDLDNVRSSPAKATCATAAEQEARRLQEAIASIANEGTTETRLRQFLADGKAFLLSQPRNLFTDLRVSHRMIAYLYEVKTTLRTREQAVGGLNEQINQLTAEKTGLQKCLDELNQTRKYEKDTALVVETSLREHCLKAHAAYATMVDQYNVVVGEWMRLNEEVKRLGLQNEPSIQALKTDREILDVQFTPQPNNYISTDLDQMKLKGAAIQDPDSFLISPLPEFTGRLPSSLESFTALPEVEEEDEEDISVLKNQQIYFQHDEYAPPHCDAAGHPMSCDCERFIMFPHSQFTVEPSSSRRTSFEHATPAQRIDPVLPAATPNTPHTLHRSSSRGRNLMESHRARSRSIPSRTTSRSHTPSRGPTRSSSPSLKSPVYSQGRLSSGTREAYTPSSAHLSMPQGRDGEVLRSRLHEILHDSSTSSSLPNLATSHFPTSLARDREPPIDRISRPPSRSGSSSSHQPANHQPIADNYSHLLASSQPSTGTTPLSTPSPHPHRPTASSSASSAAMAIEKAQRERQRAEKEQERERRRAEKERNKAEKDNALGDAERSRTNSHSQSTTYSHRELPQIYANPNGPSGATLSRRGSTAGGKHSVNNATYRGSNNGPASSQPRYPGAANSKGMSSMPTPNTPGIYA